MAPYNSIHPYLRGSPRETVGDALNLLKVCNELLLKSQLNGQQVFSLYIYIYNPISTKANSFTTAVSDQTSVDMSRTTVSESPAISFKQIRN